VRHGHSADHDNPSRYRIEAMAHTAADVVRNLGGLLFDRRCLGWDTAVLLNDCADIRPLQIIGADCADLKPALDEPGHPRPAAIATSVQRDAQVFAQRRAERVSACCLMSICPRWYSLPQMPDARVS
jgi:hypothetical protein